MTAPAHDPVEYTAYTRGERTPEARNAMRQYMAARRAAGEVPMNEVKVPDVIDKAGVQVVMVNGTQRRIVEHLVAGRVASVIARRMGVSGRTVNRNLRALRLATDSATNEALAEAFASGTYRCWLAG